MIEREPLSVSELNAHIKGLVESDPVLGSVYVRGELSNYKIYPSGHHYFTLKDAESSLRDVPLGGGQAALPARERHARHGLRPRRRLSARRGLSALLRGPDARGRWRSAGGL